jgi:hypothetical protein
VVALAGLMSPPLLLVDCASPLCDFDNFSGASNPTHVDGCCEPGTTPERNDFDTDADRCDCPLARLQLSCGARAVADSGMPRAVSRDIAMA